MTRLASLFDRLTTALAWASGAGFVLLSLYVTASAVGRYLGVFYTRGNDDLSALVLAFGSTAGLAYALRVGAHVRVDILYATLPARARDALTTVSLALMALFAGLLAVYAWRLAAESFSIGMRSVSIVRMPVWLPQLLVALGFTMLAVQALASMAGLLMRQVADLRRR